MQIYKIATNVVEEANSTTVRTEPVNAIATPSTLPVITSNTTTPPAAISLLLKHVVHNPWQLLTIVQAWDHLPKDTSSVVTQHRLIISTTLFAPYHLNKLPNYYLTATINIPDTCMSLRASSLWPSCTLRCFQPATSFFQQFAETPETLWDSF